MKEIKENLIIGGIITGMAIGLLSINHSTYQFMLKYPVYTAAALLVLLGFNILIGPKMRQLTIFVPFKWERMQAEGKDVKYWLMFMGFLMLIALVLKVIF